MDELQARIEPPFAVLPESWVFLQPCKTAFTPHRLGITANVCNSLRLATRTLTSSPRISRTLRAKGSPTVPPSASTLAPRPDYSCSGPSPAGRLSDQSRRQS
jgi:hypothetical protein